MTLPAHKEMAGLIAPLMFFGTLHSRFDDNARHIVLVSQFIGNQPRMLVIEACRIVLLNQFIGTQCSLVVKARLIALWRPSVEALA